MSPTNLTNPNLSNLFSSKPTAVDILLGKVQQQHQQQQAQLHQQQLEQQQLLLSLANRGAMGNSAVLSSSPLIGAQQALLPPAPSQLPSSELLIRQLLQNAARQQQQSEASKKLAERLAAIQKSNRNGPYLPTTTPRPLAADHSIALALLQRQVQQSKLQQALQVAQPRSPSISSASQTPSLEVLQLAQLLQQQQQAKAAEVLRQQLKDAQLAGSVAAANTNTGERRKGRTGTFPQKMHQMLADLEREGRSDIASFMPHGRSFCIHKPKDFAALVMSKYFRMNKFSSFQRQLNLYDFQRITEGPEKGAYFHELFVQGRPILSSVMKRNKIKGIKKVSEQLDRQSSSKERNHDDDELDCSSTRVK